MFMEECRECKIPHGKKNHGALDSPGNTPKRSTQPVGFIDMLDRFGCGPEPPGLSNYHIPLF